MLKSIFYLFTQEILSIFFVNLNYKCVNVKEYILPVYTRNTANMFVNLNYKSVTVEEYFIRLPFTQEILLTCLSI